MKTKTSYRLLVLVASLLSLAGLHAQPSGQWDFNSSNLTATVGAPLQFAEGPGGATDLGTAFGSTAAFGISSIAGSNAVVMRFPAATAGMGYLMPTPAANGGGSLVNNYTVIFDLLYPTNGNLRPLVDTDAATFVAGADFVISAGDGIGVAPSGPFSGNIAANTWYRIGFTVTAGGEIHKYINGAEVGSQGAADIDGRFALTPSAASTVILANSFGTAATGYVNSIQIRDVALNAGQMEALGAPTGGGIPQTIPPVPSFVQSRDPGLNATGVNPTPPVTVVLHQGDTTINSGSIQLSLDGVNLATGVTPTAPTYTATATITNILEPNSIHTLRVVWSDSVAGSKTNTWSFTVQQYQVVNLPAPFYLETFDGVAEGAFPSGWFETNNTQTDVAGFSLTDPESEAYKSWLVVTTNNLFTAKGDRPLVTPPILLNGSFLTAMANNQLCYAESDSRSGSQVQMLFATNLNCTARSNVFLSFHSIYGQNQDNIASVEYSIDKGTNWLPIVYMIDDENGAADVIRTNGVVDVGATFLTARTDQAYGSNFATYIGAPVSAALIPYVSGRINDDLVESIRVELFRLPQADNQPDVWLRFMQAGTASWWFGIDEVGLYSINTPVITLQPTNRTISATTSASFFVAASSPTPLTYQWQHAGTNISNGGHYSGVNTTTLTVSNADTNDAGSYRCVVANAGGPVNSSAATLTVIDAPQITSQPVSVHISAGFPSSFSTAALGRPPLSYQWLHDGVPIGGANGTTFAIPSTLTSDSGQYRVVVTNAIGAATSSVAVLTVFSGPINSNLVVHLKFDNNYADSSGHGNNATAVGSPGFSAGKLGQAFRYTTATDGSSFNYATLGYPPDLKFTTASDFTVAFWVLIMPGSKSSDPPLIANKNWASGGNIGWVCGVQGSGNFEWNYREECPNNRKDFDSSVDMTDGQWHHVVWSIQRGGFSRTVIDGVLRNTTLMIDGNNSPTTIDTDPSIADNANCSGNGTRNANAINIGQDGRGIYDPGVGITNALIDDVGIWRRALTAQEAVAIYNGGNVGQDLSQVAGAASLGLLRATRVGSNVQFDWVGGTGIRLQRSAGLNPVSWADVTGTLGASTYTQPATNSAYYRLHKP